MGKARSVLALELSLAALGAAAMVVALGTVAETATLSTPPLETLLAACRTLFVPDVGVGGIAALILGAMAFAVLGRGAASAFRRLRASRRFVRSQRVIERRRIASNKVSVLATQAPLAFCAGVLRPRIYVSRGTVAALTAEELDAVVAHEAHHVRVRDPLRILLVQVAADGLFFLPALRRLADRYTELAELAADRAAVRHSGGDSAPLASALLSLEQSAPSVVGIASERVDHLIGERISWQLPLLLTGWSLALLTAVWAVTLRVSATADSVELSLPLLAAQSCMIIMAAVPLMIGAVVFVRLVRRLFR